MTIPALIPLFTAIGSMSAGLTAAVSLGTTALGFVASSKQANAEEAAQKQANDNARVQAISDYDQITRAGNQEVTGAQQKLFENQVAGKKAVASATASASEGGVGGLSVSSLLSDIYGQEARIRDGVNQNLENSAHQLAMEKENIGRGYKNTVTTRAPISRPSVGGAILSGVTGIADAYKDKVRVSSGTGKK